MIAIQKIKLYNFKKFREFEVSFDDRINILVGDNEAGKSSILTALDLVLSGSRNKVDTLGLENLFNVTVIRDFLSGGKKYEHLPTMCAEIYLNEQNNLDMNGNNNSDRRPSDGLRLLCAPIDDDSKYIQEILTQQNPNFPFEYYSVRFTTFADQPYSGYRKYINHLLIDSSQIDNEYATREYIKTVYRANVDDPEINRHQNEYRRHKNEFKVNVLDALNATLVDYSFAIRSNSKSNLETDLTITEDEIPIENRGKGRQCMIKTEFALRRNHSQKQLDILLLEEPENHLSHVNMKKLVQRISNSAEKQLFVATHNTLISSRLDLRRVIMLNSSGSNALLLRNLPKETAEFFMKAPDNNVLEFILSRKVILVEGDAEFILLEAFYKNLVHENIEESNVHIISVGGTSFKRYLDLAKILQIKTAVVRDNDGDAQKNCIENYQDYASEIIKVFYEPNNILSTFEINVHDCNMNLCEQLFGVQRKTLTVLDYMLKNKAEAAFELLEKESGQLVAPNYIQEAIQWIRE